MIKKYTYYFTDKDFNAFWSYIHGETTSRELGKSLGISHQQAINMVASLFLQLVKFNVIKVDKESIKKHLLRI